MQYARVKTAFLCSKTGALYIRSTKVECAPWKLAASADPDLFATHILYLNLCILLLPWTELLSQCFRPNPLPAPRGCWQPELPFYLVLLL